ncbi:ATP-binding protein [Anaerocolumna xylanovorans]|uniref:histidine kinase n=1 Tax=Anaerocolumna xylanovorans DSM 12503 TaxID=1121345 RepID=A0A1M7YK36_9FIRM|nr:ATP-binding protein [Anaerocolumna xylanovorans]SHO52898.1 Histidine kinase-, DNA gyrase B-, and HSP90-like ATPase [Anaerocolumna xylanovorans DSM 12503]
MMTEISLNILDIAQNSVNAHATLIEILVDINQGTDFLTVKINDNGCGMTSEQAIKAQDPFYTTRTTRKVGLGIPFFKQASLNCGGEFHLDSAPGIGTKIKATFKLTHIDRMPLGDMTSTMYSLITFYPDIDFLYTYKVNKNFFVLDTKELRGILHDVPLNDPEVSSFVKDFLKENHAELNGDTYF